VAEEGGETHTRGRERFDGHELHLGLPKSLSEVASCRDGWGESVTKLSELGLGIEGATIQVDAGGEGGRPIPQGALVY